ncbi:hypothetical protein FB45DRAFT_1148755 [Roridomyces roridus]|uniref:Uncharacterized protein n=1 Tax=Roridomyces roridus TaxID=1738132 RepID=A0AAD7BXP3_9AGAR|nr:hypothetical protein FB45DRAFT_1148755 [Roridomyces roridus]
MHKHCKLAKSLRHVDCVTCQKPTLPLSLLLIRPFLIPIPPASQPSRACSPTTPHFPSTGTGIPEVGSGGGESPGKPPARGASEPASPHRKGGGAASVMCLSRSATGKRLGVGQPRGEGDREKTLACTKGEGWWSTGGGYVVPDARGAQTEVASSTLPQNAALAAPDCNCPNRGAASSTALAPPYVCLDEGMRRSGRCKPGQSCWQHIGLSRRVDDIRAADSRLEPGRTRGLDDGDDAWDESRQWSRQTPEGHRARQARAGKGRASG